MSAALFRLTLVLLAALGVAAEADKLKEVIMTKPIEGLREIVKAAEINLPKGADPDDVEVLRAAVYEHAQQEKPAGVPRYKWDGSVMEGDSLKSGAGKDAKMDAQKAPEEGMPKGAMPKDAMKKLQETFFKGLDRNKDGKLSREEMALMIEKTNAVAAQQGETIPSDFFSSLDANSDGGVDQEEAILFFDRFLNPVAPRADGGPTHDSPTHDSPTHDSERIFKTLDKNADGKLSRDELKKTMDKANEENGARGEAPVDYFATMDHDKDGTVDIKEAEHFFGEIAKMAARSADKEEL